DIVSGRHEADFLTFGLLGRDEAELASALSDLTLGQLAEWKHEQGQEVRWEPPEEVRLILRMIDAPQENRPAIRVHGHPGVVPRSDCVATEHRAPLHQVAKLRVAIAPYTRIRCSAGGVLADEIVDDV